MTSQKAIEMHSQYMEFDKHATKAVDTFYQRVKVLCPLIVKDPDRRAALVSTIEQFHDEAAHELTLLNAAIWRAVQKVEEEETLKSKTEG